LAEIRQTHATVSSDDEELILVDSDDRVRGYDSKRACHAGSGNLHRAFSVFVFNPEGALLLQQRSMTKRLWPGYWANSCCSHPRRGESLAVATQRRLAQELGMSCELRYLFKFEYQADYLGLGAEHELCSVYVGQTAAPVFANDTEVAAWRFISPTALDAEIQAHPERFTPWLKLEWQRLRQDFDAALPVTAV
jgi:isopentenyl-diphosphate Delta-isomerase